MAKKPDAGAPAASLTVRVRFLKAWGHPTRNLIMGCGDIAKVSEWIANILTSDGTAERIIEGPAV